MSMARSRSPACLVRPGGQLHHLGNDLERAPRAALRLLAGPGSDAFAARALPQPRNHPNRQQSPEPTATALDISFVVQSASHPPIPASGAVRKLRRESWVSCAVRATPPRAATHCSSRGRKPAPSGAIIIPPDCDSDPGKLSPPYFAAEVLSAERKYAGKRGNTAKMSGTEGSIPARSASQSPSLAPLADSASSVYVVLVR
jgi:hypothetical protein